MSRIRRGHAMLLMTSALLGIGCDRLGNPSQTSTPVMAWSDAVVTLETRAESVPATQGRELLHDRGPLHHADREAPARGVFVRVTVHPTWRSAPTREVNLLTELRLADGSTELRRWRALRDAQTFRALFGLASRPRAAVTRLLERSD